jgi:hypothetical protein
MPAGQPGWRPGPGFRAIWQTLEISAANTARVQAERPGVELFDQDFDSILATVRELEIPASVGIVRMESDGLGTRIDAADGHAWHIQARRIEPLAAPASAQNASDADVSPAVATLATERRERRGAEARERLDTATAATDQTSAIAAVAGVIDDAGGSAPPDLASVLPWRVLTEALVVRRWREDRTGLRMERLLDFQAAPRMASPRAPATDTERPVAPLPPPRGPALRHPEAEQQ